MKINERVARLLDPIGAAEQKVKATVKDINENWGYDFNPDARSSKARSLTGVVKRAYNKAERRRSLHFPAWMGSLTGRNRERMLDLEETVRGVQEIEGMGVDPQSRVEIHYKLDES